MKQYVGQIPQMMLTRVFSKKTKEFNQKLKSKELDEYDSSDLRFFVNEKINNTIGSR